MSYAQQRTTRAAPSTSVDLTDNRGHVHTDKVTIRRGSQVMWSSAGHGKAKIVFDTGTGSPFASTTFQVPRNGSVCSGPAVRGRGGKEFKYTVRGEKGHNDPVVAVDP